MVIVVFIKFNHNCYLCYLLVDMSMGNNNFTFHLYELCRLIYFLKGRQVLHLKQRTIRVLEFDL